MQFLPEHIQTPLALFGAAAIGWIVLIVDEWQFNRSEAKRRRDEEQARVADIYLHTERRRRVEQ